MNRRSLLHRNCSRRGIDLFSGARGWEARAHATLGIDLLGIEHWEPAVLTSRAAGLRTLHRDVAMLDPEDFADEIGEDGILVGSPPCQSRSMAGKQLGARDVGRVAQCMIDIADGKDTRAWHQTTCEDERSLLTVEPLRWALALRPRVVLLEQVPPVLPDWKLVGSLLERFGYSWWAGVLEAERFGVPQTRECAVLIARRDGVAAHPPEPTHHRFVSGEPRPSEITGLFGSLLPWVSMAEALDWGLTERPSPPIMAKPGSSGGNRCLEGGSGGRAMLDGERDRGAWIERPGTVRTGNFTAIARDADGGRSSAGSVPYERSDDEPAPTVTGNVDRWVHERPATTVNGDPRISVPGHHDANESGSQQRGAVRVTVEQAAVLQSFPDDWPWQGSRTAQFTQVGNAVPPLLGEAILRTVVDEIELEEAA